MKHQTVLVGLLLVLQALGGCSSDNAQQNAQSGDSGVHDAAGNNVGSHDAGNNHVATHDAGNPSHMVDAGNNIVTVDAGDSGTNTIPSSCKRGIAYGHHSKEDLAALKPAVAWWYNWATQPDQDLRDGSYRSANVEFVPMIWGGTFDVSASINAIPSDAAWLLGFNEPNFGSQANLSAAEAAARWPDVESIADALGLSLVSPAVNYCGGDCQDTDPFNYLDDFFSACAGCRVDAVAFHIYVGCNASGANKAQWLIDHVENYKQRFSQPLWLTEFACTDAASFEDQIAFLKDAVSYLENDARIARYAWFSGRFDGIPYVDLLGDDGQLTPLGQAYVDAPANAECVR